jgi:hypothetical protein
MNPVIVNSNYYNNVLPYWINNSLIVGAIVKKDKPVTNKNRYPNSTIGLSK